MPKIVWDAAGEKKYEVGVDRGVLYQEVAGTFVSGVAWNGLIEVEGESEGEDATPLYTGDVKADNLAGYDEYSGTITAYTYPDEFESCIGSTQAVPGIFAQQQRKTRFGLCYRTLIGNDSQGQEHGYKLHLIYNAEITGNSITRNTINDSTEAVEFAWDFSTIPMVVDDYNPYSEIIIDSTKFNSEFMTELENILYGTEEEAPRLPELEELIELFYVEEPIPPEWIGYPYERLYPSNDLYPIIDRNAQIFTHSLDVRAGELLPGYGNMTIDDAGIGPHGERATFIPADATILKSGVTDIPEEYSMLTFSTSMSSNHSRVQLGYFNNTEQTVTIAETFYVTAVYYYKVEGGE